MAAAVGQAINIPVIIWMLASDYYHCIPGTADITFQPEFLIALDNGTDPDDPAAVAPSYHNQWWSGNRCPADKSLLSLETIDKCLEVHRRVTNKRHIPRGFPNTSHAWSLSRITNEPECKKCHLYRRVTLGVLDDLRDLQNHIHGSEVSQEAKTEFTSRRAGGFFQLYEAAVIKEMNVSPDESRGPADSHIVTARLKGKSPAAVPDVRYPATGDCHSAAGDFPSAANDLHSAAGNKSHWTSGPPLTKKEVLEAVKHHKHSGRMHSGYVQSLPFDESGESSGVPAIRSPANSDIYSSLRETSHVTDLPSDHVPSHFVLSPLRHCHDGSPPFSHLGSHNTNGHQPSLSSHHNYPTHHLSSSDSEDVNPAEAFSDIDRNSAHQGSPIYPPVGNLSSPDGRDTPATDPDYSASDSEEANPYDAFSDNDYISSAPNSPIFPVPPAGNISLSDGTDIPTVDSNSSQSDVGPDGAFSTSGSDVGPSEAFSDEHSNSGISEEFEVSAAEAIAAFGYSDSEHPTHTQHLPDQLIPGPFTPGFFQPIPPEDLRDPTDDSDLSSKE